MPQLFDSLQITDHHPVGPIEERHELLAEPSDPVFDRETIRAPMASSRHFREGVIPEELMLDAYGQVVGPALHAEGVVVAEQRQVHQHRTSGRPMLIT